MISDLDTDTASAQAIFQSCDGMEGLAAATQPHPANWRAIFLRIYPGLLAAGTIALAATWLSDPYVLSQSVSSAA